MSKSAKAIKRPLKRVTETALEEGIIQGQVFTDDVITGKLVDERGTRIDDAIPAMLQISVGDELVPSPIAGVIAVEDLPTTPDDDEDFILPGEIEIAGPDEDDDAVDASFAGAMQMAVDTEHSMISTLTEEGRALAEQGGVLDQVKAAGVAIPHDYEAAYQRREEANTADFNAIQAEAIESEGYYNPNEGQLTGKALFPETVDAMTDQMREAGLTIAVPDPDQIERSVLMNEVTELVTICGYMQDHIDRAQFMTLAELREYVHALRINSGGSVSVAQLLAQTDEDFHKFVGSEDVQRKIALVEAKGADFVNVAQQISRVLGSDIVINGVRYAEYREMLRILVEHTAVVQRGITSFADILRIEVPERLDLGGKTMPVVEGMPINTKTTLYILNLILNNIRSWHASAATADEMTKRYAAEAEAAKKALEDQVKINKDLHIRVDNMRKEYAARMSDVNSWVLKHPKGFLGKKDFDEQLSFSNLTFTDILEDAIHMKNRIAAEDLAQRVIEKKPKFSQHTEYTVLPVIVAK